MLISFQSLERLVDTRRRNHIRLAPNTIHLWGIELDGSAAVFGAMHRLVG